MMSGVRRGLLDGDILHRACQAYAQWCDRHDRIYQQPSCGSGFIDDEHFVLHNVRGELARYRVITNGFKFRLRRVESPLWRSAA